MRTRIRSFLCLVAVLTLLPACRTVKLDPVRAEGPVSAPAQFDHGLFDALLAQHVDDGLVDYAALAADARLLSYLRHLAATDPESLPARDQLAFWINAYNALTLKLITDNHPVRSILRLTRAGYIIPGVTSPFTHPVGVVGGRVVSLDHIEHEVIRTQFAEPRIHFALVCAAMSCPPLRAEAYTGPHLDAQLDDQARRFLHDRTRNAVPAADGRLRLSRIFKWFEEDFAGREGGLQPYLARFFEGEVAERLQRGAYEIGYLSYDWTLNAQRYAAEQPQPVADH